MVRSPLFGSLVWSPLHNDCGLALGSTGERVVDQVSGVRVQYLACQVSVCVCVPLGEELDECWRKLERKID